MNERKQKYRRNERKDRLRGRETLQEDGRAYTERTWNVYQVELVPDSVRRHQGYIDAGSK